jgi:hypothetical protein
MMKSGTMKSDIVKKNGEIAAVSKKFQINFSIWVFNLEYKKESKKVWDK